MGGGEGCGGWRTTVHASWGEAEREREKVETGGECRVERERDVGVGKDGDELGIGIYIWKWGLGGPLPGQPVNSVPGRAARRAVVVAHAQRVVPGRDSPGTTQYRPSGAKKHVFSGVEILYNFRKFFPYQLPVFEIRATTRDPWISTANPSCHTRLSEENQVQTYMHARIKFHAYSDIKVYTETVSRKKKKDYQRFTLYPGNKGTKHHRQSTGGCVRLAPATLHKTSK
jgi:hypothetical protein